MTEKRVASSENFVAGTKGKEKEKGRSLSTGAGPLKETKSKETETDSCCRHSSCRARLRRSRRLVCFKWGGGE
jgi:hypothetical protein